MPIILREHEKFTYYKMFKTPNFKLLTHILIECYKSNSTESEIYAIPIEGNGEYCPRSFDGFACRNNAPVGTTFLENCPEYIIGLDPTRYPFNQCLDDGSLEQYQSNTPSTEFTACVDMDDFSFMGIVNKTQVIGYFISILSLFISIVILVGFRSLKCIRNEIHIHLFSTYILNNICWILWYATVVRDTSMLMENKLWCQILHVLTYYFMVTSYAWMFCEGFHLFLGLTVVFIEEKSAMLLFKFIGWVLPVFIVGSYSVRRQFTPNGTERCWIEDSDAMWIVTLPVVFSLLTSVGFLVYIIRVLVNKVDPYQNESGFQKIMKAARATMLLIPLFGLHLLLIPFRLSGESTFARIYQVFSAVLLSFQGFYVSVLFCFTNQEVLTALRGFFKRTRNVRNARPAIGVIGADNIQHVREITM